MERNRREILLDKLNEVRNVEAKMRNERPHDFFRPLPGGQTQFWNSPLKEKWIFGGNQVGKTLCLSHYAIEDCVKHPGHIWYLGSTSMDRSRKVTQRKVWESVNKNVVRPGVHHRADKGFPDDTLPLINGSVIYYLSYEMDTDKWAGDTIHGVGFDEEPPWQIFLESQKRVAAHNGQLIGAMTALKSYTKLVNRVYLAKEPGIGLFTVPLHENNVRVGGIFTDERIAEIIRQTPEEERPSRIYGIPTFKTGLVYKNWNDKYPWVIPEKEQFEIPQEWPRYMAIDPHAHTPQSAVWVAVSPEGQHYQYSEIWEEMLIPEFARRIREKNTPIDCEVAIIDNHYSTQRNAESGKTIKELLYEYGGISTVGGCDDVIARIDMLKSWDIINPATGIPRLQTFETCERTRWERQRYEWESAISEKVAERRDPRQKPRKKNDHLMNCLEYLAAYGDQNGLPYVIPNPSDYLNQKIRKHELEMEHEEMLDQNQAPQERDFAGEMTEMYL